MVPQYQQYCPCKNIYNYKHHYIAIGQLLNLPREAISARPIWLDYYNIPTQSTLPTYPETWVDLEVL